MNLTRWLMTILTVLTLVAALPAPSRSDDVVGDGTIAVSLETDRWWGVLGAAVCGTELYLMRSYPTVGMNPYAMAAGGAGCLLALLDVVTT